MAPGALRTHSSNPWIGPLTALVVLIAASGLVFAVMRQGTPVPPVQQPGVPHVALMYPDAVTPVSPPLALQDFTLPASTGAALSLSDLRGQWLVIFFGYTHCPDFCPMTLLDYKRVKAELGPRAEDVRFIYISVDGFRDTPAAMQGYLAHFDPDFLGFSGDDDTLRRVAGDYNLYYRRRVEEGSAETYYVEHTTRSYLVNRSGGLVASFAYQTDPTIVTDVIEAYLASE